MGIGTTRLRELLRITNGNVDKSVELMKGCATTLSKSQFHLGHNDRNMAYIDWDKHLFGTYEKMENWLNR